MFGSPKNNESCRHPIPLLCALTELYGNSVTIEIVAPRIDDDNVKLCRSCWKSPKPIESHYM